MDVSSKFSIPTRVRSRNPQEVWGAFISGWVGVFGAPESLHLDEWVEWKSDLWGDLCVERRIKLVFQGVGAQQWVLERRNGLDRGINYRLRADRFYTGLRILTEAQWCLRSMVSASGFPAY